MKEFALGLMVGILITINILILMEKEDTRYINGNDSFQLLDTHTGIIMLGGKAEIDIPNGMRRWKNENGWGKWQSLNN